MQSSGNILDPTDSLSHSKRNISSLLQKITFNTTGNRIEPSAYELLVQGGYLSVRIYFFMAPREVGELWEDTPEQAPC